MSIIIIITDYCRNHLRVRMVVFVQSVVKKSRVPGKGRYVHAGEFGLTLHDDVSIFVDLCFLHNYDSEVGPSPTKKAKCVAGSDSELSNQ